MFKRNVTLFIFFLIGIFTVINVYAQAVYWKDGTWQTLSLPRGATDSRTGGITVFDNVVYIAGSYDDSQGNIISCYWRNGVINTLNIPSGASRPSTSGIAVSGNVIYIAGSYYDAQYNSIACYWRNGVIQNLSIPRGASNSSTNSIAVSGDVAYIAGEYYDAQGNSIACYWRNGIIQSLNIPSGASNSRTSGITVADDVVYVAGTYIVGDWNRGTGKAIPCYWQNGVINNLSLPSGAGIWPSGSINSITVVGDVVYIAGSYNKDAQNMMGDSIPCYWQNGVINNLNLPSGSSSSTAKVITVSGNIIYVAGSDSYGTILCYWRNGVVQNLNRPVSFQGKRVFITGIAVSGNSIYITANFVMSQ